MTIYSSPRSKLARRAVLLAVVPMLAAMLASGATPPATDAAIPGQGTISDTATSTSWIGQVYPASVVALPDQCPPAADPANLICDHYLLTVDVPESYWDTHTGGAQVQITWADANNDFDLFVYDSAGNQVARFGMVVCRAKEPFHAER